MRLCTPRADDEEVSMKYTRVHLPTQLKSIHYSRMNGNRADGVRRMHARFDDTSLRRRYFCAENEVCAVREFLFNNNPKARSAFTLSEEKTRSKLLLPIRNLGKPQDAMHEQIV